MRVYNNLITNELLYIYIMDTSMVFLTLAFLVVFVAPFFIISAIKERREKKEQESETVSDSTSVNTSK